MSRRRSTLGVEYVGGLREESTPFAGAGPLVWLRRNDIEAWTLERLLDALEDAGYHCYKAPPKWTLMATQRQAAERARELVGAAAAS